MNVSELVPTPQKRVEFHMRGRKQVPATSGCYVLSTFNGTILYVGLAKSLNSRFFQHRESKGKRDETEIGRATWFYFIESVEAELNRIERSWQQQHVAMHGCLPILNKVESPMSY